jgi:hypothetical protein
MYGVGNPHNPQLQNRAQAANSSINPALPSNPVPIIAAHALD